MGWIFFLDGEFRFLLAKRCIKLEKKIVFLDTYVQSTETDRYNSSALKIRQTANIVNTT